MKAIIYCRVSTDRQAKKGASLETQRKACIDLCNSQGWEVVHIFMEEGASATSLDRAELNKLTEFCQDNRKKVDVMVVHAVDRVARETLDYKILRSVLMSYGVTLRSVTQPAVDDSPEGELMEHILAGMAQYDNRLRARRTVTGMKQKIEKGGWPFKAPLGYKNVTDASDRRIMVQDESRAPLVRKAFEIFAEGVSTKQQVLKSINNLGLQTLAGKPVSAQTLDRMLRNPLYAGIVKVQGTKIKDWTESEQANFEPIIDRETFERVQALLSGKRVCFTPRRRSNPDFPLRHFVQCGVCGKPLTASWNRGRNGTRYPHYRCQNRKCAAKGRNFNKSKIEAGFMQFVRQLQPNSEYIELFRAIVADVWQKKQAAAFEAVSQLEKKVTALRERRRALNEAYLFQKTIRHEEYMELKSSVENEIAEAESDLREAKGVELDVDAVLSFAERVFLDAALTWERMSVDQKQRFQQVLFPEGVQYCDGFYRTNVTCLLFRQLQPEQDAKRHLVALPGIAGSIP